MVALSPLDPVCVEVEQWDYDPVTDTADPIEPTVLYGTGVFLVKEAGVTNLVVPDDDENTRIIPLVSVDTEIDGSLHGIIAPTDDDPTRQSRDVVVRRVTSDDARRLSAAGVSQPREVVEAHVLRGGGMLAGELDAAVAADNTVATLVLDTGIGLYVRYSGDWQKLPDDSTSLENLSLHPVSPDSLTIYDQVDAAGESVLIFDLPRSVANTYTDVSDREEEIAFQTTNAVTVASVTPTIENITDLDNVMRMPIGNGAWYVTKRRKAMLGDEALARAVVASAGAYMRAYQDVEEDPDPSRTILRTLLAQAREAGVLSHPAVMAAITWTEWLHPRGRDGKFINKNAMVDIWPSETPNAGETPKRGKVKDITKEGVTVDVIDPMTGKPTGETTTVTPKHISAFNPVAKIKETEASREVPPLPAEEGGTPGAPIGKMRGETPAVDTGEEKVDLQHLESTPEHPTPEPSAKVLANSVWFQAADREPAVSEMLQGIIGDTDPENYTAPGGNSGKFYGWDNRIKDVAGIEDKINRWMQKDGSTASAAARKFNDALRYTVHYDSNTYGTRTRAALTQLSANPDVDKISVANYWDDEDTAYNGVNVEVHMKDGTIFEVQFHTPESQEVKSKQHVLYKQQRRFPKDSPEWTALHDEMFGLSEGLKHPEGADEIVTEERTARAPRGTIRLDEKLLKDLQADADSTSAQHLVQTGGGWDWSPERAALHDAIIEDFLSGKVPPEDGKPVFSVLGGGPAAGKSTLVNSGLFADLQDPASVLVNADEIKDRLPEYVDMLNNPDKKVQKAAAATVHEESSYLAKRLMDAVFAEKYSVVLDGTGDSSPESMLGKIEEARGNGYTVNGYYTTVPTEDAWSRAVARADKTGRFVPEKVLRGTHKNVSLVLPEIADQFDAVGLYDTSERGRALQLMSGTKGTPFVVQDEDGWNAFLEKGRV